MFVKRLAFSLIALLVLGYAVLAPAQHAQAGSCGSNFNVTTLTVFTDHADVTYTNGSSFGFVVVTASTVADGTVGSVTISPLAIGSGSVTISLNSALVSVGEIVSVIGTPCPDISDPMSAAAQGIPGSPVSGSSSPVPPAPGCPDGRLDYNNCAGPVAIYAVPDEGSYAIEVWIVDGSPVGHFGFFVSAQDLDALPAKPEKNLKIASSKDGFATLYKLTTGEYQINVGPDAEGKMFVFRFDGLPPSAYPTMTTFTI